MIVLTRYSVGAAEETEFLHRAKTALDALRARPGFLRGRVARCAEDPSGWLLSTEWEGAGAWRRALGGFEVKLAATLLLAQALDEPSAYEVLYAAEAGAEPVSTPPRRAPDAGTVGPGQSLADRG